MSKISLKPNSAGTANFEIAAPATNTDRTFTLPDEAGTVLVNGTSSNVGINTLSPSCELDVNGTGAVKVPVGTDAQRPTSNTTGQIRFNSTLNALEYSNSENNWVSIIGDNRYRYVRYTVGSATIQHHPRVSRIYAILNDGSRIDIEVFVADNCSDNGTIPTQGTTYTADLTFSRQVVGFGGYVTFGGGARGANVTISGSNNNVNFETIHSEEFFADSCGLKDFTLS